MSVKLERRIAKEIALGVILRYNITLVDFTEGSDFPTLDTLRKEVRRKIAKRANGVGIKPRILRRAILNELARYDNERFAELAEPIRLIESPADFTLYLSSEADVMIVETPKAMVIIR